MKVHAIQTALKAEGLDGWLFYDHHRRDPLAYRILGLNSRYAADAPLVLFHPGYR